jgi:hypothetical protein
VIVCHLLCLLWLCQGLQQGKAPAAVMTAAIAAVIHPLHAASQLLLSVSGAAVSIRSCASEADTFCPAELLLTLLLLLLLQVLPAVCSYPLRTLTSAYGWARAAGAACLCSREAGQQMQQVGCRNWQGCGRGWLCCKGTRAMGRSCVVSVSTP